MSQSEDPRVSRTHDLIESAFLDLYRSQPLKNITVRDITSRAGVNRATFYRHYQDKFDLFDRCVEKYFQAYLAKYVAHDDPLNSDTFYQLVYATLLFIKQWRSTRNPVADEADEILEARVQKVVFDKIMYWIEPNYRVGPCEAGTEVAGTAVSWAIFGVAIRLSEQKSDIAVDDIAGELVKMLSGGLWNSLMTFHARAAQAS